jgi:hypothetical protein
VTDADRSNLHRKSYEELIEYVEIKKVHWYKLLGHTNITKIQYYFRQLIILRNLVKVKLNKNAIAQNIKQEWVEKRIHGQFPRSLEENLVDKEQS